MGVQFDIVIPPVIAGFIILALFSINRFMLDTSVDTRLSNEMQNFANISVELLQNELRTLNSVEALTDSTIRFTTTEEDTLEIYRQGRNLNIDHLTGSGSVVDTEEYPVRLKSLEFTPKEMVGSVPALMHFRAITESTLDQQVGEKSDRIRAYAEKQIYLRNIFYE